MQYNEEKFDANRYKQEYLDGLNRILERRQKDAEIVRQEYIKDIFANQEKYRDDFKKMLGWPLVGHTPEKDIKCTSQKLSDEDGYSIFRMQFEILGGLTMTGLFFKAHADEKRPLVILQHGGEGTPELISGVLGDTTNYNDMLMRVRKHGVHVFAPQLVLWAQDYNVEYDRKTIDGSLKRVGSSITAVEIFGIQQILNYFEKEDYISSFGMVGLSYGGFYTLFTSAIDTRIKSAISCSFFNTRDKIGWSDWTWHKSAEKFDDAEIACLVYPRRLCIEIGNKDELFDYKYGVSSYERLKELSKAVGTDWTELIVFDGDHEFCRDDAPIERLIKDLM